MPDPTLTEVDRDTAHIADGDQVPPSLEPIAQDALPEGTPTGQDDK